MKKTIITISIVLGIITAIIGCSIGILHLKEHFETLGSRTVAATMYGEIASSTSFIDLTVNIISQNTFVEVVPVTTLSPNSGSCFTQSANGRLQYTCATTAQFHCASTMSYSATTNNDVLLARLGDNGTSIIQSEITNNLAASNLDDSTALHSMITLSQNEYVSVFVANTTDADDIIISNLNIFCMEAL